MTNMSIKPLWLTHFIEILLVLEFQLTKFIVGTFSYKAHFRRQISSNGITPREKPRIRIIFLCTIGALFRKNTCDVLGLMARPEAIEKRFKLSLKLWDSWTDGCPMSIVSSMNC